MPNSWTAPYSAYSLSQKVDSPSNNTAGLVRPSDSTLGLIAIALPLFICCVALTRRRYRALNLRRKIQQLERIWQLY